LLACLVAAAFSAAGCAAPSVEVLAIANCGFLIRTAEHTVLVDALFRATAPYPEFFQQAPSEGLLETMISGGGAFHDVQLALVTHAHQDHLDPATAVAFLGRHPETTLVGPEQVRRALSEVPGFARIGGQVRSVSDTLNSCADLEIGGILVRACTVAHSSGSDVVNTVFRVDTGGTRWIHEGDAAIEAESFSGLELDVEGVDLFLAHDRYVMSDAGREILATTIRPSHVVLMHHRWAAAQAARDRLGELPESVLVSLSPVTVLGAETARVEVGG
jgi:L-ascorbate metabolism protein UlaG (beta-lactamase superfamily)